MLEYSEEVFRQSDGLYKIVEFWSFFCQTDQKFIERIKRYINFASPMFFLLCWQHGVLIVVY